jgi:hypothetical protein
MALKNVQGKFRQKTTPKRSRVTWIDNTGSKPAPFVKNIHQYVETVISEEQLNHLVIGSLWLTRVPLSPDHKSGGEMLYLMPCYIFETPELKPNSILIYSGPLRIEERAAKDKIVSVVRHTFVSSNGRYVITNFNNIAPVT